MKFGFIGVGNMGSALAKSVCKAKGAENVLISNRTREKCEIFAKETGAVISTNDEIAEVADYIFLGVKPQMMGEMLNGISEILKKRTTPFALVTMAAALSMETIEDMVGGKCPVIRIMPNTPVSIGEGVVLTCKNELIIDEVYSEFTDALKYAGLIVDIEENKIDAGSALSGCGPAFVQMFIEALSDGAVSIGIKREDAITLACKTLIGSAKLTLETKKHPGELKDQVCSPGGSTIAGVRALEECGFRGTVMDAVIASYEKTLSMK